MYGKDDKPGIVCFSRQKRKLSIYIGNSEKKRVHNEKSSLKEATFDFMLTDYTTIARSKLALEEVSHNLGYIFVIR